MYNKIYHLDYFQVYISVALRTLHVIFNVHWCLDWGPWGVWRSIFHYSLPSGQSEWASTIQVKNAAVGLGSTRLSMTSPPPPPSLTSRHPHLLLYLLFLLPGKLLPLWHVVDSFTFIWFHLKWYFFLISMSYPTGPSVFSSPLFSHSSRHSVQFFISFSVHPLPHLRIYFCEAVLVSLLIIIYPVPSIQHIVGAHSYYKINRFYASY